MTINERIEYDIKCINTYFKDLKVFVEKQKEESITSEEPKDFFIDYRRFDMIYNIYGLVDYWHPKLCELIRKKKGINKIKKDKKDISDLEHRHNYLKNDAKINFNKSQQKSYKCLDELRIIRNNDAHFGAYSKKGKGTLEDITEQYLWESLEHAKNYLFAITADLA